MQTDAPASLGSATDDVRLGAALCSGRGRPTIMRPRASTLLTFLCLCVAVVGMRALRLRSMAHYLGTQRYEDIYYLPPPAWLEVFSLGHREALAGLVWARALVYFGEEVRHQGEVRHVFDYAEAIVTLDPDFRAAYAWVGSAAIYRTGSVTEADVRRAISYLERGARRFPNDGQLAWNLGATYAYELPPLLADERAREEAKRIGTEHLEVAARLGAGPPWLVLANASQLRRLGQTEQAIRHLEEMYSTVRDPETRDQIEAQLGALRSQAYAEALRRTVEELEQRRRRDFPYVGPDLFLLLGPRPPVDEAALLGGGFDPQSGAVGPDEHETQTAPR